MFEVLTVRFGRSGSQSLLILGLQGTQLSKDSVQIHILALWNMSMYLAEIRFVCYTVFIKNDNSLQYYSIKHNLYCSEKEK